MAKRKTMTAADAGAMRWKGVSKKARQAVGRKGALERERRRAAERERLADYEKALREIEGLPDCGHRSSDAIKIARKALGPHVQADRVFREIEHKRG